MTADAHTAAGEPAVTVVRDSAELDDLAGQWAGLYARSSATPFQAHAWVSSWWRAYGLPGRLRLVLVHRHGRLVAAAPLMLQRRPACRVLVPLGRHQSDFTDILLDQAGAQDIAQAVRAAILAEPGWDVIDFPEVRPGAAVERLRSCWTGPSWQLPASTCVQLPGTPIDRLLTGMPGRKAGKLRRRLREIERLDLSVIAVPAQEAEHGISRLLDLHALQWRGRALNAEHARARFKNFLAGAAAQLIAQEKAVLSEYRIAGRLMAADLALVGNDFIGGYLYGAHPDLRAEADVLTLLLRRNLDLTHGLRRPTFDLLRGDEVHKEKWGGRTVSNHRLILGRSWAAAGYAAAARARLAARDLLKQRSARTPAAIGQRPAPS